MASPPARPRIETRAAAISTKRHAAAGAKTEALV